MLILFFDSVGRRHFIRRMPEAAKALEVLASGPDSISRLYQFFRYHVTGWVGAGVRGIGRVGDGG